MKKFRDLAEAKDTIVFGFGRFNPPTTGHEKVIQKTVSVAGSNPYRIFPSHTQNPKKDPLPQALKTAYMRKMFKKYARNIVVTKSRNAIEIAVELYDQGYKNLVMVVGSDRVKVFDAMLKQYNGVEGNAHGYYKFDSIKIVSAGERDPDSEGVEGMSASKMRAAASEGDMDSFLQGIPSGFSDGKKLYRDVRKYMGIREEREMGDMNNYDELRDAYLTGKIWNAGDIVEANGLIGEIVRKGTNYLSFMSEDGKVHKAWLHEINEGVKDLPPHLQKLVKQLDKKEKELEKKGLKVKTFVYNPDTGKPDIELDELFGIDPQIFHYIMGSIVVGNTLLLMASMLWVMSGLTIDQVKKDFKKVGEMVAKIKKDKNYKPSTAEKEEAKQFIDKVKKQEPSFYKKLLTKVKSLVKKEEVELDERNYRKEYDNYHAQPEQREKNAARLRARRLMVKNGKVKPFDDMDVHHKDNNPLNNEEENLEVTTKKWNRTEPRLRTEKTKGHDDFALIDADNRIVEKGTEEELKKKAQDSVYARLRVVPAYKQKVGDRVRNVGESVELGEEWWDTVFAKISQMTHPKDYGDMVKDYAELMKQKKYKDHPSIAASKVAREHDINIREFIKYINKLIAKKILPKELTAEYELGEAKSPTQKLKDYDKSRVAVGKKAIFKTKDASFVKMKKKGMMTTMHVPSNEIDKWEKKGYTVVEEMSFKDLVQQIQERELTDTEQKRREEIAKDMSDENFKKKYGDRWKEVKMAVATNMAKKES